MVLRAAPAAARDELRRQTVYPLRWPHLITHAASPSRKRGPGPHTDARAGPPPGPSSHAQAKPETDTHADARRVRLAATILFAVAAEFLLSGLWFE